MKCGFFLNIVVCQCASVLKLFSSEDESLLIRRNTLLILNLLLNVLNAVGRLHLNGDSLPRERFDKDLHFSLEKISIGNTKTYCCYIQ